MGKIVASYLIKAHVHADDVPEGLEGTTVGESAEDDAQDAVKDLTNEQVKAAVIAGLGEATGLDVTVSLVERTDD